MSHLGDICMSLVFCYKHLSSIRINRYLELLSNASSAWTLALLSSSSSMSYSTSTSFSSSSSLSQVPGIVTFMNILDLTRFACCYYGKFNALG